LIGVFGSCPSVGISGFILGGGHSVITSYYGISTHYLKEVEMILPNNSLVTVNDENDPSLMKVLRGGG
jgi:FAD/FMN-containing dehydrogenase